MGARATITLTTAVSGSGKSYLRCARFYVDEALPHTDLRLISNFPLGVVPKDHTFPPEFEGETFVDRMVAEVAKKHKRDADELRERIEFIPEHVLQEWRDRKSGPWDWFANQDISGCHISIDEIHNYCGKNHPKDWRAKWQNWLGEIRHQGATLEFISQNQSKIAPEIIDEAGVRIQVFKRDQERDPIFKIPIADWYELRAKFLTGKYTTAVIETEQREENDKWVQNNRRCWWMDPYYHRFYDSYSAPQSGKGHRASLQKHEFQKRSRKNLLAWFILRNFFALSSRFGMAAFVVWLSCGGMTTGLGWFLEASKAIARNNGAKVKEHPPAAAVPPIAAGTVGPSPALSAEVVELRQELEAAKQAAKEVERRAEIGSALALITENQIVFRDGSYYGVGEPIASGPLAGRSVESIDLWRRTVRLDDGQILRLGIRVAEPAGLSALQGVPGALPIPEPKPPTGVSGHLRRVGRGSREAASSDDRRTEADGQLRRSADRDVLPVGR